MTTVSPPVARIAPKMILVVALLVAVFASAIIDIVGPVAMIDIGKSFNVLPGTAAQLGAFNAIASVITALLLGAVGFRFRYKTLVVAGVLLIAFCAVGLYLAPTFPLAQLIYPINGIGSVLIIVTAQTFIGNSYPLDKRAKAIGWVAATTTLANAVGSPVVGYLTGISGWRSSLVWFMLPTAVLSLVFVFIVFPYDLPEPQQEKKEPYMKGFKQVLSNRSAVACLTSAFFINACVFGGMVFEVTFYRQVFSTSPSFAAVVGPTMGTAFITVGAVVGGHAVNRVGRKRLAVATMFLALPMTLLTYFIPDLWLRVALRWTVALIGGISVAASINLMLEQAPQFRRTAMSLSSAFVGVGTALGIFVAGAVLNLYANPTIGFQVLGSAMAAFGLISAFVLLFFARDPIKNPLQPTTELFSSGGSR